MAQQDWTEDRVETLKTMWAEGYSCSRIAIVLGPWASRCAVIGKISRLGLTRTTKTRNVLPRRSVSAVKQFTPAPVPADAPEAVGPVGQFAPTGTCQWIYGEIGKDWRMCGNAIHRQNSPWCVFHFDRARDKTSKAAKPTPFRNDRQFASFG